MRSTTLLSVVGIALALSLSACSDGTPRNETSQETREAAVRSNGSEVMPFDLDKTLHTFSSLPSGGDQTVTVRDKSDASQIKLIREHLSEIATDFSEGNFSDPSTIHGLSMPGLSTLSANPDQFTILYLNVDGGAKLEYQSTNPEIITALHAWFAAQLSDHGSDAMEGHLGSVSGMTPEMMCAHHPDTCNTTSDTK